MKGLLCALAVLLSMSVSARLVTATPGTTPPAAPSFIAISEELAPYVDQTAVVPTPVATLAPEPTPVADITPEPKSRGQLAVEEQLRQNREKLRQMRGEGQSDAKSGKEKIDEQLRKNREALANRKAEKTPESLDDLKRQMERDQQKAREEVNDTRESWRKEIETTYAKWREEQKKFLSHLKEYKANLVPFQTKEKVSLLEAKKPASSSVLKKIETFAASLPSSAPAIPATMIPGAFDVPIRDQGNRPTCASFAGVRAAEVLLAAKNVKADLSPQYFYWASKPECQQSPCSIRGSWVTPGMEFTSNSLSIPLAEDCPYKREPVSSNETQIPLVPGCQKGKVSIKKWHKVKTLDDVVTALSQGSPVVAGFKLSENFYKNNGLVLMKDAAGQSNKEHAEGHAILLVGMMNLPKKLQSSEGKICIMAANSWGEGWGKGGHACLSEKWFMNYRYDMAFVALDAVEVTDSL